MRTVRMLLLVLAGCSFWGLLAPVNARAREPRNIIVMISDGWGYNTVTATNYYEGRTQDYQAFPVGLAMSTYSANGDGYAPHRAWSEFDYIKSRYTDSASAGTAMATGVKTYDAAIGVGMDSTRLENIVERAERLGKVTGVVTSVEFSHATPATFVAHNVSRNNYSEIANEMLLNSAVDLIMGAGHPLYNDSGSLATTPQYRYVGGQSSWDRLLAGTAGGDADGDGIADPWTLIQERSAFQTLATGTTPRRVVGVAKAATTLQQGRGATSGSGAPYADSLNSGVPSLVEMTEGALNVLDNDPDGFFLMVEGGAVDWAAHANQSARLIEEQSDFNRAVEAVIRWIETSGGWEETLLVVTGDHETGYLTGPGSGPDGTVSAILATTMWQPIQDNGAGRLPGMEWHSGNHTNQLIPLFARGTGSERLADRADEVDPVRGSFLTNTELGQVLLQLWPSAGGRPGLVRPGGGRGPTWGLSAAATPKNVILLISDGWGFNTVAAADYYQFGEAGQQAYQRFPVQVAMSTYSADGDGYAPQRAWSEFDYIKGRYTDSASAGTAMATGTKTYDAAIGVDMTQQPLENVIERAEWLGKATGVVTSVEFSHATPATFVAHNINRNNYSEIANEMLLTSAVDLIMGAGHPLYNDSGSLVAAPQYRYVGGQSTWESLIAGTAGADADGDGQTDPWILIQDREEFIALADGQTPGRVVGVARAATTLQQARGAIGGGYGTGGSGAPYADALNEVVPTLVEMTRGALNVLDDDPEGFFLMIEGGAVDWAAHANQSGRVIEEQIDFNETVQAVVDWVETRSGWDETLVIVTGDHETGYLTGPGSGPDGATGATINTSLWKPIANHGRGNLPGMEWHSPNHTNQLIPLFAKGLGSDRLLAVADDYDPVRGPYINNTDLGRLLTDLHAGAVPRTMTATTLKGRQALVVDVLVESAGGPLAGVTVNLARGVVGRPDVASAQAATDGCGLAMLEVEAATRSASGLYTARVSDADGGLLGSWNSLPLNGGQRIALVLTVGGSARVVDHHRLAKLVGAGAPLVTGLAPGYPNPFNPEITIPYILTRAGRVRLSVYDLLGQEITTLVDQVQPAGRHQVVWPSGDLASGTYLCRLEADGRSYTQTLTLTR